MIQKKMRDKVDELKLGRLLTHKNIRNVKHKDIKDIYIMDEYLLLKQCINVEHSICEYKKYKRCQLTIKYFF